MKQFLVIALLISANLLLCYGQSKPSYPAIWFAPINDPKKPDWEILPQERHAGEVILSKREDGKTAVHGTHALRTPHQTKNDIQTTLRELPLDKLEKLGEMIAELKSSDE